MRYAVAHVISSPAGAVKTARLVISDVPDKTPAPAVVAALDAAGYGARFSEGGVKFGNHEVLAEGRNGWPKGLAGIEAAEALAWAKLTAPQVRGEGRRVTLRLTEAEHATLTLAAQRSGLSLQEWAARELIAAAGMLPGDLAAIAGARRSTSPAKPAIGGAS